MVEYWPYMVGYGLPLGLCAALLPDPVGPGSFLMAIAYPVLVIGAFGVSWNDKSVASSASADKPVGLGLYELSPASGASVSTFAFASGDVISRGGSFASGASRGRFTRLLIELPIRTALCLTNLIFWLLGHFFCRHHDRPPHGKADRVSGSTTSCTAPYASL
ncbi:unnamed protein product, partial [Protopolystoma xenopodis]